MIDTLVWCLLGALLIMAPAAQRNVMIPFGEFFTGIAFWFTIILVLAIAYKLIY